MAEFLESESSHDIHQHQHQQQEQQQGNKRRFEFSESESHDIHQHQHGNKRRFDASRAMNRLTDNFVGHTLREDYYSLPDPRNGNIVGVGGEHPFAPSASSSSDHAHHEHFDDEEVHLLTPPSPKKVRKYSSCSVDGESTGTGKASIGDREEVQKQEPSNSIYGSISNALHQIPAIALIAMFHLMIGIPFGVSYFPIGWAEDSDSSEMASDTDMMSPADDVHGKFPIAGKDALGIRIFLFSTIIGQLAFTYASGFDNPISLQMVENVPFSQTLCRIVIKHTGFGIESLSTIMFMFGLSSVFVGVIFYLLGRLELGRVTYFFPTHVLVGCIAGIGLYIVKTGVEVTINQPLGVEAVLDSMNLLYVVIIFEVALRVLEYLNINKDGKPRFALLSPIFFCMITPIFYTVVYGLDLDIGERYFFPQLDNTGGGGSGSIESIFNRVFHKDLFDMWRVVDLRNISWSAVVESIPTMMALSLFSLIHVPINIPAFAISTNTEADMNKELIAHGYSNIVSGLFGGLQNYMAYTQSVLYARSGGKGKSSGIAVAVVTSILFFIGPLVASKIPRCMAGTLLVHVGVDLFLEGTYDTIGKFERLEYSGIWLITIVMTIYGMNAAMIAGGISAVSTYAVQTVAYLHPIRGQMTAATLRSSKRDRGRQENEILDSQEIGRNRILMIQLQGHLFFGNMAQLNESIHSILSAEQNKPSQPWIVIMDFSLVLGIDSSAAQAIINLKKIMRDNYDVRLSIFVPGSEHGFPCAYRLTTELDDDALVSDPFESIAESKSFSSLGEFTDEETAMLVKKSTVTWVESAHSRAQVCQTLDLALVVCENALISHQNPSLLKDSLGISDNTDLPVEDEKALALRYLINASPESIDEECIDILFSHFEREVYQKGSILWSQGEESDCAKLLVRGVLEAHLENEAGTRERVQSGRVIGELGLVHGDLRMSSVHCASEEAIVYSLSCEAFKKLVETDPSVARVMDLICIMYLANRVQHVSNRIFETRCLPI
jgi:SulP family sulfate permease